MDNFIEFLDSYKYKDNINYYDFVHIINASNVHYQQNYDGTYHGRANYNQTWVPHYLQPPTPPPPPSLPLINNQISYPQPPTHLPLLLPFQKDIKGLKEIIEFSEKNPSDTTTTFYIDGIYELKIVKKTAIPTYFNDTPHYGKKTKNTLQININWVSSDPEYTIVPIDNTHADPNRKYKREKTIRNIKELIELVKNNEIDPDTRYGMHCSPQEHRLEIINTSAKPYEASNPHRLSFTILLNVKWESLSEPSLEIPTVKTKSISIDFSIESIRDLIDLLDKNPYDPAVEYNIDLKGLHQIRQELVDLDAMVGIRSLKNSILNQLIYFIQEPLLENNSVGGGYKHTILCGPPGTGKTETAKIIGKMYSKLGILKNSTFKKVTRSDLVAGYLGQTAIKTKEVIDKCLGGCLFIDEAYSLGHSSQNDSFSKECLDTLCEALSDHKDDLMVIIAGYENELEECFFGLNVGLKSRFIWKFKIDEYNAKELFQIFEKKIVESKWKISILSENLLPWFESKKQEFKNYGRDIEQLLYYTKICHSRRIYGKSADLAKKITMEDLNKGFQSFLENQSEKKHTIHYGLYV